MPRSMDVILRHEAVEKGKAGDKCIFTGMLIVVPDLSAVKLPGGGAKSYRELPSESSSFSNAGMLLKMLLVVLCCEIPEHVSP